MRVNINLAKGSKYREIASETVHRQAATGSEKSSFHFFL